MFFFQAEDGIRDIGVTGVQTCALPILLVALRQWGEAHFFAPGEGHVVLVDRRDGQAVRLGVRAADGRLQIGREAGRGRGEISVGAVLLKKKKSEVVTYVS